jgi:molybdate transport system substrate-binding protein
MQDLGKAFEKANGVKVIFNFAGSNELAQQIVATPKADLFLSAAENWMDTVEQKNRLVAGTRGDLLSNTLIVVAQKGATWKVDAPCAMATLGFKHLSLGDPKAVPAGKYAQKWLSSVVCGGDTLWNKVKDRVAPAPDVRAALGLVTADPDVVGIVYRSDWLAYKDKTDSLYEVKDGPAIRYVVAQIAGGPAPDDARKFLEFLGSVEARDVFEGHGFLPIASSTSKSK